MSQKRDPYRGLEIQGSEFRLLILQPGSWEQELNCNLETVSHPRERKFEALSYTWGDVRDLHQIAVSDASIGITANLKIALHHLRRSDSPRTLWIDALCIDQEDHEEKGRQVQRMGEIFSTASSVLAWLGPPDSGSEEAMSAIDQIGKTLWPIVCGEKDDGSKSDNGFEYLRSLSPEGFEQLGLCLGAMNWEAIWALCERSYWHRVWIIQELALAGDIFRNASQNRCIVGCGSTWISLPVFSAFVFLFGIIRGNAQWMEESTRPPLRLLTTRGAPAVEAMFQIVWSLDAIFNEDEDSRTKRSLGHLLRMSRKFQATDSRDKLYAFLELAESQLVTPDYTLSASEVYVKWVQTCIETDRDLFCLHGNRELSNTFGPSWIPELYSRVWDGYAFEVAALDDKTARLPAAVSFIENDNILKARGISLGVLDRVVGPFSADFNQHENNDNDGPINVAAGTFERFLELVQLYLSLPKHVQERAWRAFILDMDTSNRDEPKSPAPDSFHHLWRVLISLDPIPDSFDDKVSKEMQLNRYLSPFTVSLDNALYSERCFFVTDGLRVGLGPKCTRPGDEVVLLFGSPLCFVLRRVGERYTLIGDAYVQDAAPELWSTTQTGDVPTAKDFLIH